MIIIFVCLSLYPPHLLSRLKLVTYIVSCRSPCLAHILKSKTLNLFISLSPTKHFVSTNNPRQCLYYADTKSIWHFFILAWLFCLQFAGRKCYINVGFRKLLLSSIYRFSVNVALFISKRIRHETTPYSPFTLCQYRTIFILYRLEFCIHFWPFSTNKFAGMVKTNGQNGIFLYCIRSHASIV